MRIYSAAACLTAPPSADTVTNREKERLKFLYPHVNTGCMQLFLDEVSAGHPKDRIIMVMDGAGWHRSHALKAPEDIYLLKLPLSAQL